jgi:hypothetical protein
MTAPKSRYYITILGCILTEDHEVKSDHRLGAYFSTAEAAIEHASRYPATKTDGPTGTIWAECRVITPDGFSRTVAKQARLTRQPEPPTAMPAKQDPGMKDGWIWTSDAKQLTA